MDYLFQLHHLALFHDSDDFDRYFLYLFSLYCLNLHSDYFHRNHDQLFYNDRDVDSTNYLLDDFLNQRYHLLNGSDYFNGNLPFNDDVSEHLYFFDDLLSLNNSDHLLDDPLHLDQLLFNFNDRNKLFNYALNRLEFYLYVILD